MPLHTLGLVVNPKLREPVLVGTTTRSGVRIYRMLDESDEGDAWYQEGSGYYEEADPASSATGAPRVHTPDGVEDKGMGFGTALYTGLVLGVHVQTKELFRMKIDPSVDGISSRSDNRSHEASEWWDSAVERDLASRDTYEDTFENVDVTSDFSNMLHGESFEHGDRQATVTHVDRIEVDGETEMELDVYTFESASDANLVLASFVIETDVNALPEVWRKVMQSPDAVAEIVPEAILALDVRPLSMDAMNLLGLLAERGGASEDDLHMLRARWEFGLDPEAEVRQMRLPFQKPNRRRGGQLRRNAREAANARAMALREQTGWMRLDALP